MFNLCARLCGGWKQAPPEASSHQHKNQKQGQEHKANHQNQLATSCPTGLKGADDLVVHVEEADALVQKGTPALLWGGVGYVGREEE